MNLVANFHEIFNPITSFFVSLTSDELGILGNF